MITKFRIKLEGPSCSGKSTFISRLMKEFVHKDISIEKVGDHELEVITIRPAFPEKNTEKKENLKFLSPTTIANSKLIRALALHAEIIIYLHRGVDYSECTRRVREIRYLAENPVEEREDEQN